MKFNMKLFKSIGRICIFTFIIIFCIYILYFSHITLNAELFKNSLLEGNTNMGNDCSNCTIKPSSTNCLKIRDISYILTDTSFAAEIIDTSYIFCPWQPNCEGDYLNNNMLSPEDRLSLTKSEIKMGSGIINTTCCSGSYDPFYNNNTISYSDISFIKNTIKPTCNLIDICVNQIINSSNLTPKQKDEFLSELTGNDYVGIRSLCNTQDISGMLFEVDISNQGSIITDPNLSIQEILEYQNTLEMKLQNTNNNGIQFINADLSINNINKELQELDLNKESDVQRKIELQNQLNPLFYSSISYETISYKLLDKNENVITNKLKKNNISVSNEYLLNSDEFFNCFGRIDNYSDMSLSDISVNNYKNLYDNNLFDIADGASYKTQQELTPNNEAQANDLTMELKNLQSVKQGGTAPVGVINQYLRAINGFYEKQISNMMGPKTHSVNDQLVFNNDNLEIKTPTFFEYNGEKNNEYECQPGVTGDENFKDCGPPGAALNYSKF